MERVKFYSNNDIMTIHSIITSEKLIKDYGAGKEPKDINDIIELYNVKKYFDNEVYLKEWEIEYIKYLQSILKLCFGKVAKFFNLITEDNFLGLYDAVYISYKHDFWELMEKFEVYKRFSVESFQQFINTSKVWFGELLKHKKITEHFGIIIRDCMVNNPSSAKFLLDKYEIKHITQPEELYFPRELSNLDKEDIICSYIDSEEVNLNYLRLIANIQSSKDRIEISPRTLLKARRKVEEKEKQLFHDNFGISMYSETIVSFSKSQDEEVINKVQGKSITATYSTKWIEDNTDYATLLNNFIYLFEFVDLQMRCLLVNKDNQMGVFEKVIVTTSKNAYTKGRVFDKMNELSLLQITGYYNLLFSIGIRLEEVIEWFFKEYISKEFGAHNFKIIMPSVNSTLLEKCTNIMPAMESVLKQFSLYVQEGQIDFELLEIRSEHLIYKNIQSLVYKKYVYGTGDEFKKATFLLFSNQSSLSYNIKATKSYKNYFELVCNEKTKLEDYPDYCISLINWLVDHKYLLINEEEYIIFRNKSLIMILKDLYLNEVISYWTYEKSERKIMDELEKKNVIEFENSLFSRVEQNYINYYLNKAQFNNGLDLRNKYSHTQPNICNDDKMHNQNYMIFLRLFILTVIKINDDFCISNEIKNQRNDI